MLNRLSTRIAVDSTATRCVTKECHTLSFHISNSTPTFQSIEILSAFTGEAGKGGLSGGGSSVTPFSSRVVIENKSEFLTIYICGTRCMVHVVHSEHLKTQ